MPTILRLDGYEVRIRTHDHTPPHVHVFYSGYEVVIDLGDDIDGPSIRDFRGMPSRNLRRALDIVIKNRKVFALEWIRIHG
jgi:hypothetical protein